jgi:hypothetical protein
MVLLENHQDIPYSTSDNPITLHDTLDLGSFLGNLSLKFKGIQIHILLTKNLLLVSLDTTTHRLREDSADCMLERLGIIFENMLQVQSSSRFIYASSDNDFERAKSFLSEYPLFKNPNRRRTNLLKS